MQTILTYLHTRLQKYPYIALPGEPMQAYRMNTRGQPPRPVPLTVKLLPCYCRVPSLLYPSLTKPLRVCVKTLEKVFKE